MKNNEENGFMCRGCWIIDPTIDETCMYSVNPVEHYSEAYVIWFLSYLVSGKGRPKRLNLP